MKSLLHERDLATVQNLYCSMIGNQRWAGDVTDGTHFICENSSSVGFVFYDKNHDSRAAARNFEE